MKDKMKNTFLDQEEDLRHYLALAIAEASDQAARALERDWIMDDDPPTQALQDISFRIYRYQRPLTADNFLEILKNLNLKCSSRLGIRPGTDSKKE